MGKDILKGTKDFNSIPHSAFKEVLLISKSPLEGGVILVLGYLRYYSNLEKLPSVDFYNFAHFYLSIIIPKMRSMNYFGHEVILEILEYNTLKSYFGNSEIAILSSFLEIS